MGLRDGLGWRWRILRRRWFLVKSFRNGVSLALGHRARKPRARAVWWDGTVIAHPPGLAGLPETLLEIWYDEVYTRDFYTPSAGDVIVDGGANIGLFSLWIARQAPCRIVAFEPFEQNYAVLLSNLEAAGASSSVDAVHGALSGKSGHASMARGARSLDHRLRLDEGKAAETAVRTYSLAEALDRAGADVDLCKLDIEGSERDVFEHVNPETLGRVRRFAIEYHDNLRPGTLALLETKLGATHDLRVERMSVGYGMLYALRRT
jgi:FkbM family methyltransferase